MDQIYGEQKLQLEEQLLEIPLKAPYLANQEEFQVANTRFEKEGEYFRVIKQRYQNDTLQLVYVPDTARQVIDLTVKKWISSLMDEDAPQEQSGKTFAKLFAKDYLPTVILDFSSPAALVFEQVAAEFLPTPYQGPFFALDSPPPQLG